jgi:hypothetical protein
VRIGKGEVWRGGKRRERSTFNAQRATSNAGLRRLNARRNTGKGEGEVWRGDVGHGCLNEREASATATQPRAETSFLNGHRRLAPVSSRALRLRSGQAPSRDLCASYTKRREVASPRRGCAPVSSRAKSRDLCASYKERREVAPTAWEWIVLLSFATSQTFARHVNHAVRPVRLAPLAQGDTGAIGMTQKTTLTGLDT